ncbi:Sua5/YciO/YrdC/YwlC family protein [Buchnera aphidicola]|uniref:Sua5/YciO/YrdC/YwlC family protein n=1 Tax=Buchnera aphidicola TaxID=9 RepID=UPI00223867ED|nr:Sua5/YciO/YrdC/YwlC family protein [Buchnera aphidicola]MCW5197509.1 Sua5/YciO/YrdC/YwlC family protein [Buchnera aphidicola (Chaitophorus viminalis)]
MNKNFLSSLQICIQKLNQNEVIAYPTESVFGLGCNPDSEVAVKKLLFIKNRTINKGFILVSYHYNQLIPYIIEKKILQKKHLLLNKKQFLTYLVPAHSKVPIWLTGNSKLIAVRITQHKLIKNLCFYFNKPIISTSANISGEKPCETITQVKKIFGQDFPILNGFLGNKKKPSKIINLLTGEVIRA